MKKIAVILCLLWIGMIFYLSSEPGKVSNEKSLTIVDYIKKIYVDNRISFGSLNLSKEEVFSTAEKTKIQAAEEIKLDKKLNVFVRKSGHFIEYLVLSIILSIIMIRIEEDNISGIINVLFICLLVAVFDEYYQSFTGRTSKVGDVLIDFGGGILGVFLCIIYQSIRRVFNIN